MNEKRIYKKMWRFFTIAEFEAEEQWLNELAQEGWQFVRTELLGLRFVFVKGEPARKHYKIDVVERTASDEVKESYFTFLTECGIRVKHTWKDWVYLEKEVADGPFDVAHDNYAKLRRTNKVYDFAIRTLCRLLRIFMVLILLLSLVAWFVPTRVQLIDVAEDLMTGVGVGTVIALTLIWVPIINKLRRKMNTLIREIGVNG